MKKDRLSLFAISIDSESLIDPPVWTKQVTPYSAQTSIVSGNGINASDAATAPKALFFLCCGHLRIEKVYFPMFWSPWSSTSFIFLKLWTSGDPKTLFSKALKAFKRTNRKKWKSEQPLKNQWGWPSLPLSFLFRRGKEVAIPLSLSFSLQEEEGRWPPLP